MKLLVYSHDAYGLGNIRRMLGICEHLLDEIENLSILLVSGSPMLQGFRLPIGLDYIKLPCLNRGETGKVAVKYLGTDIDETVKLRSDLILSAIANYKPDLVMVDKKPYGLQDELKQSLNYIQHNLPQTKLVLLLRDILDTPKKTIAQWRDRYYYQAIEKFYDQLLVVGMPEVFDFCKKYQFSADIADKIRYCGYIHRQSKTKNINEIHQELQLSPGEKLVLVTPGGGQDGYHLLNTYLDALAFLPQEHQVTSLIFCGPEMSTPEKQALFQKAEKYSQVQIRDFTDDLMSYITASDTIISMAGYNTVCEILSAAKPALIVPRVQPSQEQLLRSGRMNRLGLFPVVHPDNLTPELLMDSLLNLLSTTDELAPKIKLDMNALPRITHYINRLLFFKESESKLSYIHPKKTQKLLLVSQY
ncbi:MAG: glycosyltransferase [Calothrix sp. MO_167.B42]|nr:glycosyltransferase [Calothrix sp. MO_167.B42]